jgi:hypothetical protein
LDGARWWLQNAGEAVEPIEPDVWRWYHDVVGKREAVIVDT